MPGPLPDKNHRHRNAPAIPTTELPASGRRGRPPKPPYELGPAGAAWWRWAWALPQAMAWSKGDLYALARRARLEDDAAALGRFGSAVDLAEFLEMVPDERTQALHHLLSRLKAQASGMSSLDRERRELDDRFGLSAKGMAALRWKIVDDAPAAVSASPRAAGVSSISDRRARLTGAS